MVVHSSLCCFVSSTLRALSQPGSKEPEKKTRRQAVPVMHLTIHGMVFVALRTLVPHNRTRVAHSRALEAHSRKRVAHSRSLVAHRRTFVAHSPTLVAHSRTLCGS